MSEKKLDEIGIRDHKGRPCKVPFLIMRHSDGSFVIGLNDYLIKGSFPNSAKALLETEVSLEALADALAPSELKAMLDYRLAKLNKDMENRP